MIKVAVIFGGMSSEHDISMISGTSILKNLDKEKYDIYPMYIDKNGKWFKYDVNLEEISVLKIGEELTNLTPIENIIECLNEMDCVFPVLHGLFGEDGTIQGLFELIKVPYVGCKVLASSVSMDKAYTKILFDRAKLKQAKYVYIKKVDNEFVYIDEDFDEYRLEIDEIVDKILHKLKFPMFIKPSNSGSSIGVNRADSREELKESIKYAANYDRKILIEQGIIGREVECAVLGNDDIQASCVGEVKSAEDFYSFSSKYKNIKSSTDIPAKGIDKISMDKIREMAIKAFKAVDGSGLSRVDFFIEKDTNDIYINEINTMPGFTNISMYPKLFEFEGLSYKDLLDKLISLAMKK